jgi:signal transduction histidine kinase
MEINAVGSAAPPNLPIPTLAEFIRTNIDHILQDWEDFAQSLFPAAALSRLASQDHAKELLLAVAADIAHSQSAQAQEDKAKGLVPDNDPALQAAAQQHGLARVTAQFDLEQLIAEFRAVRGSVLRRWAGEKRGAVNGAEEITRFNESIDEALASSVRYYSRKHEEGRTVIIGVLAHDLRNPLHAALMGASYIIQHPTASAKCIQSAGRITACIKRCNEMVSDLLDYARSKLGQGIPMSPHGVNLRDVCTATIEEVESAHPGRTITAVYSGELNGTWDSSRIAQLLGNLLTNALKHGHANTPVLRSASGANGTVAVEIHNDGPPIPLSARDSLFNPLYLQGSVEGPLPFGSSGLGLGLYICREIAVAHAGDIEVKSSLRSGTSFTVTLPQHSRARSGH